MNKECSPARHVDDSDDGGDDGQEVKPVGHVDDSDDGGDDGQEVQPAGHVDTGAVVAGELLF